VLEIRRADIYCIPVQHVSTLHILKKLLSATYKNAMIYQDMENHERVERELLEQCGQIVTLVECFT